MIAIDFIDKDIPALSLKDNVRLAVKYMQEEKLNQLVLLNADEVLGIIEEDILFNFDEETKLDLVPIKYTAIEMDENSHILDLADHLANKSLEICPIVNHENKYIGSVRAFDIYKEVIVGQFSGNGSILSLEIDQKDYSLSDISRIIETEGLRIEKLFLAKGSPSDYHFIIKLNKKDISSALNSLKRFGYKVTQINKSAEGAFPDQERFEHLMKYLEI
jgi:predicted transcriptional regulator